MINRKAFIVGIKSTSLSKKEIIFLKKYKPWGVILFSRNVKGFEQIKKLIKDIRFIFKDKNYPILIDQEGGRVNRLNKLIETSILTAEFFGNLYKKNKKKFFNYYKIYINQISYLLNEIGANINTVPVLDVRRAKSSNVIGDRSYSSLPKNVSKIGDVCIEEFKKSYNFYAILTLFLTMGFVGRGLVDANMRDHMFVQFMLLLGISLYFMIIEKNKAIE